MAQGCGLGLDVSVSRRSRDPLRPRSRLGRVDERLRLDLGLEIEGLGIGIGLGQLGIAHVPGLARLTGREKRAFLCQGVVARVDCGLASGVL